MSNVTDKVLSGPQRVIHRDWRSSEAFCAYPHNTLIPGVGGKISFTETGWSRPGGVFPIPDVPEYAAFCYGTMPAYVFADWLEENIADIPAGLLQLLRESDA